MEQELLQETHDIAIRLEEAIKGETGLIHRFNDLEETIKGNGKPGLCERVEVVETKQRLDRKLIHVVFCCIGFVAGALVTEALTHFIA